MTMRLRCAALMFAAAAAVAQADDGWTLTTADFKTEPVTPTAIDGSAVTVTAGDGSKRSVPLASIVQLARPTTPPTHTGLVLCTTGGGRLVGTPRRIDGANLVWATEQFGEMAVPVESVLAVLRDRLTIDGLNDTRGEDQAKLVSGDVVRGILTEATPAGFVITPATGDAVKVQPAAVASILFASPPGGRAAARPPAFVVRSGAYAIACDSVTLAGGNATLQSAGAKVTLPWAKVDAVEHTGGPVAWLSSREPTQSTHTPYLDGNFPARFDTTVTGEPIRFGGVTYAHGIGVHSRSKLVFAVLPGDKSFRTRYAIDGSLSRANVDVRVSVDGRVVHEQKGVTAGRLGAVADVDLSGAKTITLDVDYGRGYDVQDRLNWIEPAVLRE